MTAIPPDHPTPMTTGPTHSRVAARRGVGVRDSTAADLAGIQAIYAHHVRHGLASFEAQPPPVAEMGARSTALLALGLPYLVAERDRQVVGYCYATAYRPRPAYR